MVLGTKKEGDCYGYKRSCDVLVRAGISAFGEMPPLWKKKGRRDESRCQEGHVRHEAIANRIGAGVML